MHSLHRNLSLDGDSGSRMDFFSQALAAVLLVALTLCMQSAGMAVLIHWAKRRIDRGVPGMGHWRTAVLVVRCATFVIILHILQILCWAAFYRWRCLPSWESSFYFSAASYSTVGYGDVVLPPIWRLMGPIESVAGVLMCGISVSALFAIVTRLISSGFPADENAGTARSFPLPALQELPQKDVDGVKLNEIG